MPRRALPEAIIPPQIRLLTSLSGQFPQPMPAIGGERGGVVQTGRMRTELVSEPGDRDRPNEDYASVALPASGQGGSLVVLDGVTPLAGDAGCLHSVPWFTARLGGALSELTVSQRYLTLTEALSRAIARTADAHAGTCDLSHPRTPQATVVLARWDPARVEYLILSDSTLLVETASGEVTALLDDRLARIPRTALTSHTVTDATLRNKEGGFFTAAADPTVARRAVTGSLDRSGVRTLTALTDGATRWTDRFAEGDWRELVTLVRKEGGRALIDRVRTLERAAAEGAGTGAGRYRGKTHDDATVVFVEL